MFSFRVTVAELSHNRLVYRLQYQFVEFVEFAQFVEFALRLCWACPSNPQASCATSANAEVCHLEMTASALPFASQC